jgi:hypothetical protein
MRTLGSVLQSVMQLAMLGAIVTPTACTRAEGDPSHAAAAEAPRAAAATNGGGPIVLELFTSQGCSSCPPADALLAQLASAGTHADRRVAPLAFHVDYWNELGWADPYSLPAWTARQNQYADALHDNRVYTPELVVGGAAGMVGSDRGAVHTAIEHAAIPALLPAHATWAGDAVAVTATAPADADVWVAVWEENTTTKVTRGENSGETLGSVRVVRRLEHVAGPGQTASTTVKLDPSWRAPGAIAFAQRGDRRIVASSFLPRS